MNFSPIDIELIKSSPDIVSTIGQFVELKRAGSSWKALCPFHKEKSPSFVVTPTKGMWKCFGCGLGGDVVAFLMLVKNLTFPEVLEELAEQNGIEIHHKHDSSFRKPVTTGLFEAVEEAQKFYKKCFGESTGASAKKYLSQRGIDDNQLQIGIGYAPAGNALFSHLQKLGYSTSILCEAGLVVKNEDNSNPYDRFRNRLTFPIKDRRGRVVSFGARALGDGKPKYLNGPETAIYKKGTFLYGFSDAQKEARNSGTAVLVEGYFDHARLLSVGIKGVVATSGTAFTDKQARNFVSMADKLVICYDGDKAGSKAAVKAAEILLAQGSYPLIIRIPDGKDPDDYIAEFGVDAFKVLLNSPHDPISFCIQLLGGHIPEGPRRSQITKRLLQVISASTNPLIEEDLIKKVEKFTGYSRTALQKMETVIVEAVRPTIFRTQHNRNDIDNGDKAILKVATVAGRYDRNFIRFLKNDDMKSDTGLALLLAFRAQLEEGYSEIMFAAFDEVVRGVSLDIVGNISSITSDEILKVKKRIEKNRVMARRKMLKNRLSEGTPEQKAMDLEELADGGILHES